MELLELPVDLFHKILVQAVISRGVRRALRLRLVSKQFQDHLQPALFESRLLDEFDTWHVFTPLRPIEVWHFRKNRAAENLWHAYLSYRVKNERDPEVGRFTEIRQVAEQLCKRTDADYEETLNTLCWLALQHGSNAPGLKESWHKWSINDDTAPIPGLNLLSAAAYLGYIDLAKELLSDGHCPTVENFLFPSPMRLAAYANNADILMLFQEHLPEYEEPPPRGESDFQNWRGKTGPGSIVGALLNGNMDTLRLAVYPPSRSTPSSTDFCGQPYGKVDPKTRCGSDLRHSVFCAITWEGIQYVDAFFEKPMLRTKWGFLLLARHTEAGNLEMVRHFLDAGVVIHRDFGNLPSCNLLAIASRYWHEDIVDLLLERGADPNFPYRMKRERGTALMAAATGGSMAIVRKLLASGADIGDVDWQPLGNAVRLEHTGMVEYFLEIRDWSDDVRQNVLRQAEESGLDSMVQILHEHWR